MLKPPGPAFKRVSVASTLCQACAQRIEHPTNYVISVMRAERPNRIDTRLGANELIVIHACTTSPEVTPSDPTAD